MSGRTTIKTGIVALDRTYEACCPVVTFRFPGQTAAGSLLVTLTLCEWQSIARQIADAATAVGR